MAAVKMYDGSTRGSEEVIRKVKRKRLPLLILFGVFSGILLAVGIIGLIIENYVMVAVTIFFLLPFLIPWIVTLIQYLNPRKCNPIKRNPQILEQADYLFSHIAYQNEFIVACPEYFAIKTDISRVFAMNEVLQIYKRIVNTNYGTTYSLVVETVREPFSVVFPKSFNDIVDQSVQVIAPYCPYVKLGYGKENQNYVEYMRTMWAEAQKQGMAE